MMKSVLCMHENSSIWGHFRPVNLKNIFHHGVSSFPRSLEILSIRGISVNFEIFFSHAMVKPFTLVRETPSVWGYFWSVSLKIFFNHGEVIHSFPWKSINIGVFLNCDFQNFLQPWWSIHSCPWKSLNPGAFLMREASSRWVCPSVRVL